MKKQLLLSTLMLTYFALQTSAQFNYTLSVQNATYTPLSSSSSSVNGTLIWDDDTFTVPLGFAFNMDGIVINTVAIEEDNFVVGYNLNGDTANAFMFTDADLHDRGWVSGSVSRSPIRYEVSGTDGSKIVKLEIANAGFYDENDLYSTDNDSLYLQIWFYQGTNVIEFHFGPSNITHYADYYYATGQPLFGYAKRFDINTMGMEMFYYMNGSATSPTVDSTADVLNIMTGGLNTYPSNGTVYKFTPKFTGIKVLTEGVSGIQLVNNISNNHITVKSNYDSKLEYKFISISGSVTSCIGSISKGTSTIDISSLPTGMYMLNISGNEGYRNFKVTKQ